MHSVSNRAAWGTSDEKQAYDTDGLQNHCSRCCHWESGTCRTSYTDAKTSEQKRRKTVGSSAALLLEEVTDVAVVGVLVVVVDGRKSAVVDGTDNAWA